MVDLTLIERLNPSKTNQNGKNSLLQEYVKLGELPFITKFYIKGTRHLVGFRSFYQEVHYVRGQPNRDLQSVTKLLSRPPIFSLFAPVFPPPPSHCCSTTKCCRITRVISIRYFFQNNIDMGERGDENFIFL